MSDSPSVEMVVTSFDDPMVVVLQVEREAEAAARSGGAWSSPAAVDDAGVVHLVARRAGDLLGYTGLRRLGDHTAGIERVYVRPEHRRTGVTRLLLAGAEDLARRRGFAVVRLGAANLGEGELYTSRGYVRAVPALAHVPPVACFEKALCARVVRQGTA